MSERIRMPDSLRDAVSADLSPVRPLPAPWIRVLWAVPLAMLIAAAAIGYFGTRPDFEGLDDLMTWVPVLMQVALGLAVLTLALHETVPGLKIARPLVYGVCLAALAVHLAANLILWLRDPMGYSDFLSAFWGCLRYEFLLGVPLLALITYLSAKALPVRPSVVGTLAGIGAGVISDASWRMICYVSAPTHFLTAHLGAILVLGATGYLVGSVIERRLEARRRRSHAGA
ncbi:MAG: NrsF family protein [Acidobacteriota bacterium]|jgi:hypothetical protein